MLIGSLASFGASRLRLNRGPLLTNAALLTYAIPASFLIVPYYRIMHAYGLADSLWAVIAAQVTFATPFAILILQLYARLIPVELDDMARVDGATALQMYARIYPPLMTPALAVVAIYALLLASLPGGAALNETHDGVGVAGPALRGCGCALQCDDGGGHHLRVAADCTVAGLPSLRLGEPHYV